MVLMRAPTIIMPISITCIISGTLILSTSIKNMTMRTINVICKLMNMIYAY